MAWPPTFEDLKRDLKIAEDDIRDDPELQEQVAAAVSFVQRVRPKFNYDADPLSDYPDPPADLWLGTVRLAVRWYTRRRSPAALIEAGDMGQVRVPGIDPDIERLLRIGRHGVPSMG